MEFSGKEKIIGVIDMSMSRFVGRKKILLEFVEKEMQIRIIQKTRLTIIVEDINMV